MIWNILFSKQICFKIFTKALLKMENCISTLIKVCWH